MEEIFVDRENGESLSDNLGFSDGTQPGEPDSNIPEPSIPEGPAVQQEPELIQEVTPSPVPVDGSEGMETPPSEDGIIPEVTPTPTLSPEDLLTAVTACTEEIKTLQETVKEGNGYLSSIQLSSVCTSVGLGLVIGVICAIIFANYLRH